MMARHTEDENDLEDGLLEQAGGGCAHAFSVLNNFYTNTFIGACLLAWFTAAITLKNQVMFISFFLVTTAIIFLWAFIKRGVQKEEAVTQEDVPSNVSESSPPETIDNEGNLKRMGVEKINDNLYDLCSGKDQENAVVIFFHGLELDDRASSEDTWLRTWTFRDDPKKCWPPQMFSTDEFLIKNNIVVRAYAAKYDASVKMTGTSGRLDIYLFAENLVQTVIDQVMRRTEEQFPIFLVAHSYGGIVVQELIKHAFKKARNGRPDPQIKKFLQCLAGIFFYAVPHGSLVEETYNNIFRKGSQPLAEAAEMLSQFNKELSRSRAEFRENINAIKGHTKMRNGAEIRIRTAFEVYETELGHWKGKIVEESAVDAGVEAERVNIEADHFKICKPASGPAGFTENRYCFLQQMIVDVVKEERSRVRNTKQQ
ncbi:hypothetical protein R1flu_016043 [Riccia fluitans]|uniref:DUF676 domain-containing protein n=1 Tax=Riccia fluitans TaxID=41844 RepID=A0ABD1YPJ5_9MARC